MSPRPKKRDDGACETQYNDGLKVMTMAYGTMWWYDGLCSFCGEAKPVMEVDPEQAGYSVYPICLDCINAKFTEFEQMRGSKT